MSISAISPRFECSSTPKFAARKESNHTQASAFQGHGGDSVNFASKQAGQVKFGGPLVGCASGLVGCIGGAFIGP
jgi:hypothetical protein